MKKINKVTARNYVRRMCLCNHKKEIKKENKKKNKNVKNKFFEIGRHRQIVYNTL